MRYLTEIKEIEALFLELTQAKIIWLDTEVADYMTKNPRLSLIQILPDYKEIKPENSYILDILDKPALVEKFINLIMVNPNIEKVFHNAKYDKQFLGKTRVKNVTCTLEMAQKMPYYVLPLSSFSLKNLAENIAGFAGVSKEEQGSDWGKRPLSGQQLKYAQMDTVYLAKVHHKLLQLLPESEVNPTQDNLEAITKRYRQIELQWKLLNSEIEQLKERAKKAMEAQNIKENSAFQLSSYDRTIVKANLIELSQMIVDMELEENIDITLTKELQKQLEEVLKNVNLQEEKTKVLSLKIKPNRYEPDFNF
jgi:ribonuclease D